MWLATVVVTTSQNSTHSTTMSSNAQFRVEAAWSSLSRRPTGGRSLHVRLTDAGRTGYFVIQANVKKSAKMNAVPTQIHILPVSPVPENPDSPTVADPAVVSAPG
jgi:hypothetical protein